MVGRKGEVSEGGRSRRILSRLSVRNVWVLLLVAVLRVLLILHRFMLWHKRAILTR